MTYERNAIAIKLSSLIISKKTESMSVLPRYLKVKVEHYLLFMLSPPKISLVVSGIKYICLHLLPVFYLIQPSSKQIFCFDFRKQNSVLPMDSMYLEFYEEKVW